jgi:hypothetical protein
VLRRWHGRTANAAAIGYRKGLFRANAPPNSRRMNIMIRHVVMWKLKETAEGATRAENAVKLKEKLEACRNIVPGILRLEVGLAAAGLESTYDVVLDSDFADKAALDAYQVHPTHEALKSFVGGVREARQCVDYEV